MVMMEKLEPLVIKDLWVPQERKAVMDSRDLQESLDNQ